MKTTAIIVGAGSSVRMGKPISKQLIKLNGKETILHTLTAFQNTKSVSEIVVVCRKKDIDKIKKLAISNNITKATKFVNGGNTRQQSVLNGVSLVNDDTDFIAIHDGARPLIEPSDIEKVIKDAEKYGSASLGTAVTDTIKIKSSDDFILSTPNRDTLIAINTPQVFKFGLYKKAMKKAKSENKDYTDDCQLVESIGEKVYITLGKKSNIKLTTPEDIIIAESFLDQRGNKNMPIIRVGHGYDVHKLVENRKLIIGGIEIPYSKGLLGHSDADVLVHAVMDALLGAAALGDIGKLFPDTDPEYSGANSIALLKKVCEVLKANNYQIVNIDSTIIAQAPKLKPYIDDMRNIISNACKTDINNISVKATTEEKLGFTGSGDGISAHAVCLIEKVN